MGVSAILLLDGSLVGGRTSNRSGRHEHISLTVTKHSDLLHGIFLFAHRYTGKPKNS